MNRRWLLAAAALLVAAAGLVIFEPIVLGDVLGTRRGGWLSAVFQQGPFVCAALALIAVVLASGKVRLAPSRPQSRPSFVALLARGIPRVDARTAALFRIVFATGLLIALRPHAMPVLPWVQIGTNAAIVMFGAGLFARAALTAASVGVFVWMSAWTEQFGAHPVGTLVVALPAMIPGRWSDAWSLDAVLRRRRPGPPGIAYGYGIWIPLLVVGVALAAAAWAKLITPDWIDNGTVKFALVADYHRASVDWGLWIASHPHAAVGASAAAVIIEAVVITAAFARSWIYRFGIGLCTAALFAGFFLLQGELWRGWWLLFLSFLPWQLFTRATVVGAAGLTPAQTIVPILVVASQVVASLARLEIRPAISAYDMYSTTFRSPAAFDRANPMYRYRFEATTKSGTRLDLTDCFGVPATPAVAREWQHDTASLRQALAACDTHVPPDIASLHLYEALLAFDWTSGRFYWKVPERHVWEVALP